jgi:hypothetical protein
MAIVEGDILRTTINMLLGDGTLYQNVYHHQRTGIGVISEQTHIDTLELWAENAYNEIIDFVRNTVVEQLCYVDKVAWDGTEWAITESIGTFTPTFNPAGVQDQLPNQVSAFCIFKTARPKSVGRKFLMPFIEASQEDSLLVAGALADVVAYADDVVNSILLTPLNYLVPGVPRTGVNSWLPFTVAVVTNLLGTQRRRRRGYGV